MPPKAKAVVARRPAARPRGLRRPAAAEEEVDAERRLKKFSEVDVRSLVKLGPVVLDDAK